VPAQTVEKLAKNVTLAVLAYDVSNTRSALNVWILRKIKGDMGSSVAHTKKVGKKVST
jgi:tRNA threonylcarbamoyladenosine modification (KEOPS) complex  Pcc1 subunit